MKGVPTVGGIQEVQVPGSRGPVLDQEFEHSLDLNLLLDVGLDRGRKTGADGGGHGNPQYLTGIALDERGEDLLPRRRGGEEVALDLGLFGSAGCLVSVTQGDEALG
jgi:hypothetical protein